MGLVGHGDMTQVSISSDTGYNCDIQTDYVVWCELSWLLTMVDSNSMPAANVTATHLIQPSDCVLDTVCQHIFCSYNEMPKARCL